MPQVVEEVLQVRPWTLSRFYTTSDDPEGKLRGFSGCSWRMAAYTCSKWLQMFFRSTRTSLKEL